VRVGLTRDSGDKKALVRRTHGEARARARLELQVILDPAPGPAVPGGDPTISEGVGHEEDRPRRSIVPGTTSCRWASCCAHTVLGRRERRPRRQPGAGRALGDGTTTAPQLGYRRQPTRATGGPWTR
jgi:hypothetical protein